MNPSLRLRTHPFRSVLGLAVALLAACGGGDPTDDVLELDGGNLGVDGAHEHGIARLALAVDGTEVTMTFRAPGASLHGFEHEPRDDAERRARDEALATIRDDLGAFVAFDPAIGCEAGKVQMSDDEAHEAAGEHGHAAETAEEPEHPVEAADPHDHGDDSGAHDEAEHDDGHSEVEARVVLRCGASPEGSAARLRVDEFFPGVMHVDLIVLSGTRQGGARVDPGARIEL